MRFQEHNTNTTTLSHPQFNPLYSFAPPLQRPNQNSEPFMTIFIRRFVHYGITPIFLIMAVINFMIERGGGGHQHGAAAKSTQPPMMSYDMSSPMANMEHMNTTATHPSFIDMLKVPVLSSHRA